MTEGQYECDVSGKNNTTITGKENTIKQHFNRYCNKFINTLKGTFNTIYYTVSNNNKVQKEQQLDLDKMKKEIEILKKKQLESDKTIYELNKTVHKLKNEKRSSVWNYFPVFITVLLLIAAFIMFKNLK